MLAEAQGGLTACFFRPIGSVITVGHRILANWRIVVPYTIPSSTIRIAAGIAISATLHMLLALGLSPRVTDKMAWQSPLRIEVLLAPHSKDLHEISGLVSSNDALRVAAEPQAIDTNVAERRSHAPASDTGMVQFEFPFDRYFAARELDVRASQINEVQLIYPKRAYEMRIAGKVILRIFINEHGSIDMTSILAATPPGVFEEAAFTATQALQFSPALKNGREVKSQKTIEVVFNPYERISMP